MNIDIKKLKSGDEVRFVHPETGRSNGKTLSKLLNTSETYTVERIETYHGRTSTTEIFLVEIPSKGFNVAHFELAN